MVVADAQDQTVKQIGDVEDFLARRAVAVFMAPRDADGLEPALDAARRAGTPVILVDREADGTSGIDHVTFVGSDFVARGRRAGEWLARATGGRAGVVELTGTPGSAVARDCAAGFRQGIAGHADVRVVASQTGSFFLGATSLGGRPAGAGSTLVGVLLLAVIFNAFNLEGSIPAHWPWVLRGAFLVGVVALQNRLAR